MSKLQKILIGAAGASALALSASPAMAKRGDYNDRYERYERHGEYERRGGYGKGDRNNNRYDRYNRYRGNGYQVSSRRAVKKCKRAIRRHLGHAGEVRFRNIGDIRPSRYGTEVVGRLVLQTHANDDRGRFRCTVNRYGKPSLRFRGLWDRR